MSYTRGQNPNLDRLVDMTYGDPVCVCGHKKAVHRDYGCRATVGRNRLCGCRSFREAEENAK